MVIIGVDPYGSSGEYKLQPGKALERVLCSMALVPLDGVVSKIDQPVTAQFPA